MPTNTAEPPPLATLEASDRPLPAPLRRGNARGIWAVVGRVAGVLLSVVIQAVLARVLSTSEFGQYVLILNAIAILSVIARFGLSRTLVRYIAEGFAAGDRERVRTAISLGLRTLTTSLLVCCILTPPLLMWIGAYFSSAPAQPVLIAIILGSVALGNVSQFIAEVFRGMHDQKNATVFDANSSRPLANGLFLLAIVAAVVAWELSVVGVMSLQLLVLTLLCVLGVIQLRRALPRIHALQPIAVGDLPPLKATAFLAMCAPLMITEIIGVIGNQSDVWIIGTVLNDTAPVGLFGAARRALLMVSMSLTTIQLVVLPSIPKLYIQKRTAELQSLLQRNATAAMVPAMMIALPMFFFPGLCLSLLFGAKYADAATCLAVLCAAHVFHIYTGNCGQLLMMTGRERVVLGVYILASVLLITIGPPVTHRFGINGFAIVSACILVMENVIIWLAAKRLLGVWTHASPTYLPALWRQATGLVATHNNCQKRTARTTQADVDARQEPV